MYKTTTAPFRKNCTNSLISHRFVAAHMKPIIETFFYPRKNSYMKPLCILFLQLPTGIMSHMPYGCTATSIQTSPTSVAVVLCGELYEASQGCRDSSHVVQLKFRKCYCMNKMLVHNFLKVANN